mmetsp:Transcript_9691/g.37710  ORF Transcript_9691/g.37710 Transcript_9691/m.37710 type:complete len:171 (-) Transcript_9691:1930-2442(-)
MHSQSSGPTRPGVAVVRTRCRCNGVAGGGDRPGCCHHLLTGSAACDTTDDHVGGSAAACITEDAGDKELSVVGPPAEDCGAVAPAAGSLDSAANAPGPMSGAVVGKGTRVAPSGGPAGRAACGIGAPWRQGEMMRRAPLQVVGRAGMLSKADAGSCHPPTAAARGSGGPA